MKITIRDEQGRTVYSASDARRLCEHLAACGHAGPLAPDQLDRLTVEIEEAGRVVATQRTAP